MSILVPIFTEKGERESIMIQQCVESSPDSCIKMFLAVAVPVSVDPPNAAYPC
jgi:hypothetical protein